MEHEVNLQRVKRIHDYFNEREKMTMKLLLIFVAMDLLTVLIYPLVYAYGMFNRFVNRKEKVVQVNTLPLCGLDPIDSFERRMICALK